MRKRIVKLSQNRVDLVFRLLNLGNSIPQIALKSGMTKTDVNKLLKGDFKVVKNLKKVM